MGDGSEGQLVTNFEALYCPGCGLKVNEMTIVAAPGGAAAAECFGRFGALLAASYQSPARRQIHQLIVDAYTVQHGGGRSHREVQAIAVCLMTLYLFVSEGVDPRQGPALHKRMADSGTVFTWVEPPPPNDWTMTVGDVLAADDENYVLASQNWAKVAWAAWKPHHATVQSWIAEIIAR